MFLEVKILILKTFMWQCDTWKGWILKMDGGSNVNNEITHFRLSPFPTFSAKIFTYTIRNINFTTMLWMRGFSQFFLFCVFFEWNEANCAIDRLFLLPPAAGADAINVRTLSNLNWWLFSNQAHCNLDSDYSITDFGDNVGI